MNDVKELRERYNLTRAQLADLFGIPVRTVQSWELGDRSCPVYVFGMMEQLLKYRSCGADLLPVGDEPETDGFNGGWVYKSPKLTVKPEE